MEKRLMTNTELVDSIVVDINNMIKEALSGQYLQICYIITAITQKLMNLKNGIDADIASKNEIIEQLKEQLRVAGAELEEMPPEAFIEKYGKKDGAE